MEKPAAELVEFSNRMRADIIRALSDAEPATAQYERRIYARALFAYIEGTIYLLKRVLLKLQKIHPQIVLFTDAERSLLLECSYEIDAHGRPQERPLRLKTLSNIVFTLNLYDRVHSGSRGVDKGRTGWEAFKKALQVRHRITHPKRASDVDITDDDLVSLMTADNYFHEEIKSIVFRVPALVP